MTAPVFSGFLVTDYRNPHQSPIRFKAWFRDRLLWSLSLPLASICPRKSLVPCCVQLIVTNLWLYGQPFVARSIGGLWRLCLSDFLRMEQFPNHISWFYTNPNTGSLFHSIILLHTSLLFNREWNSFHFIWVLLTISYLSGSLLHPQFYWNNFLGSKGFWSFMIK